MSFPNAYLLEEGRIVVCTRPVNTTGTAQASPWINMGKARRVDFIIIGGAWAGGTPAVTLAQATDISGTGTKTLSFNQVYKFGQTNADDPGAPVTVTGDTYNLANSANQTNVIEIHQQDLDGTNGFNCVQLNIASPGANADLICIIAVVYDLPYSGKATTLPSVLT